MRDIAAAVVEIEAADVTAARAVLAGDERIRSIAQLGTRLHALLDRDTPDPQGRIVSRLGGAGVTANVQAVPASLEDVFVVATGFRGGEAASPVRH
jgi:ABC-2 type transport system ATP-binding protein